METPKETTMTHKEKVVEQYATYLASLLLSEPDKIQQEIERIEQDKRIPPAMRKDIFEKAQEKAYGFLKKAGEAIECKRIS